MAHAGTDRTVFVGDRVVLDGGASSDVDGDPLSYFWALLSKPADSAAVLSDDTAVNPGFTLDRSGQYVAQLIVNDGHLDSAPDTVLVNTLNSRPLADAGPPLEALVGDTVSLDGGGSSDWDGDPLGFAWSVLSAPAGSQASFSDPAAESPTFTPDLPGLYVPQLIVNDGLLASEPDTTTMQVAPRNQPPVITSTPELEPTTGMVYEYDVEATDPEAGDTLTYALTTAPAGMTIDAGTGQIAWTPMPDQVGTHDVTVRVEDGEGLFAEQTFQITVVRLNRPPVAVDDAYEVQEGESLVIASLTSSALRTNALAQAEPFAATRPTDSDGKLPLAFEANAGQTDPRNNSAITTTNVGTVGGVLLNDYDYDPDGDPITAVWVAGPNNGVVTLNSDGTFTYTPAADFSGTDTFNYKANDGALDSNIATVTIAVLPLNGPPVITSEPVTAASTQAPYAYDVEATDPEVDPLTFSLTHGPSGMAIDPVSGLATWSATAADVGIHPVTLVVEDGQGGSDSQSFELSVSGGNMPPSIISEPVIQGTFNEPYSYNVQAVDPDADVLSYALTTAPAGMTVDAASGHIQWTPIYAQVGDHAVRVEVSDGNGGSDSQDFTVSVLVNHPPEIVSDAVTAATTGEPYVYDVEAIDPDDDPLSYSLMVAQDCLPPPPDFAGWWTGDGVALDIANRNDGEERLGASYGPGMVGKGFSLDGIDDYVYVPYDPIFHFGEKQDFTIDAWVNLQHPTPGFDDEIVIVGDYQELRADTSKKHYRLRISRDTRLLIFAMGSSRVVYEVQSTQSIPLNQWTHVAAVRTGTTAALYINSSVISSVPEMP